MADVNANIGVNIDTSGALANLRALQKQISAFHSSMAKSGAAASAASADMQQNLINTINRTGKFAATIRTVKTTTESFTSALEKNKLSMGEYFRYAGASTKTFGRNFQTELGVIDKVARERVKTLQTQYIKLGRDASGAMKAIAVRPLVLDMQNLATQTAINAQKQQLFNQLLKQGSTNLLNWGKNTQWAGRQLMVGFTIPLTVFGTTAAKTFMDMEKQALRFRRVYGELLTPAEETNKMVKQIQELAAEFTKYGVAVADTMSLAADVAAMGKQGADLTAQVAQATRLAVLGNVEQTQALETTISVTNAFGTAAEDLAGKIDFLNAVENQTVTSIEDLTIAIPKAGPVVQQLGGDVEDLAFFLTAMKEGGINASEGANALKSGLASLINPTGVAAEMLKGFGINIKEIVEANKGNVSGIVVDFAKALDTLDPLARARAIEQLFGKFQFSRLSTLFQNVIAEGTQANRVLQLAGATSEELARLSASELGKVEETLTFKFQKAIEDFKLAIAPIGEQFLKFITPIIEFGTKLINKFNEMDEGVRGFVANLTIILGGLGPVLLMTIGLAGNFIANLIKGFATFRNIFDRIRGVPTAVAAETEYMTQEQLQSLAVSSSLEQIHNKLKQTFTAEAQAVDLLTAAYSRSITAQRSFVGQPVARGTQPRTGYASGVVSVPGPKGAGDIVPAMLSPGEAVIPADMAKQYAPLIQGMIAGNIPGYARGVFLGMPKSAKSTSKNREAADQIYQMLLQSNYANTAPTEYGHQLAQTSGHSFPIFGLGGVYQKGDKQVFVKPVMDEKAAIAEMRATEIARRAHGLKAPNQRIVVIRDPMDTTRQRRFLALESDLDPTFVNNQPMALFNEDQYFRQLVASLLRADKDLSASNVFGDVLADVGPAGVFNRASGLRDYAQNLPSMEDQAMINLLGIKGGAKRAFAESTLALMTGLTPEQYHQRMIAEIQNVLPKLKQTVASFGLNNPTEVGLYDDMIRRLEAGLGVNWRRFHEIHSAVKIAKPKQTAPAAVPGYANGVVSVPGPKGKGDVVPAMLSPGEAVIPAAMAKKYAPLIQAMVAGNIPGYALGNVEGRQQFGRSGSVPLEASHVDIATPRMLLQLVKDLIALEPELASLSKEVFVMGEKAENGTRQVEKITMSLQEIADLPDTTEILAGGYTSPGTAVMETQKINQAMDVAGVAGVPTSLAAVVEAGRNYEAALNSGTEESQRYADVYRDLIAKSQIAAQKQSSVNAAQEELTYTLNVAKETYKQGLISSRQVNDANEAEAMASLRIAEIEEKYARDLANGISQEQALRNARIRAFGRSAIEAGTGQLAIGPRGTGAQSLRQVASGRGGSEFNRIGQQPGEPRFAARGVEGRNLAVKLYNQKIEQSGQEFSAEAAAALFSGINRGLGINSPSREFENISENVAAGVRQGEDDAKKAGEAIAVATATSAQQTGTRRLRRASTDPETMAAIAMLNSGTTQSRQGPRRASSPAGRMEDGEFIPAGQGLATTFAEVAESGQRAKRSFSDMLATASTLTFSLTSLAGIGSMAGGALGEFSAAIFQISGVLFAVNTAMQVFQMEAVASRVAMAKQTAAFASYGSGIASRAGFMGILGRAGVFMKAFLGPVGLVTAGLAALAGILVFVNNLREEEAKKIKAFGDAAFLTSEKLKTLGAIFNVTPKEANLASKFIMPDLNNVEINATQAVLNAENFKTDFAPEILALQNATPDQAQALIESMQLRLQTAGFGPDAIKAIISAIMTEAGKTDLNLEFLSIDAFSEKGITDLESKTREAGQRAAKAFQEGYSAPATTVASPSGFGFGGQQTANNFAQQRFGVAPDAQAGGRFTAEARQELNLLAGEYASFFESIAVGVENASAPAEVLTKDLNTIVSSLQRLDPTVVAEILPQIAEKLNIKDQLEGLEKLDDQILLIKAAVSGIDVGPFLEDLKKGSAATANGKDVQAANVARGKLNALLKEGISLRIQENAVAQQTTLLDQLNQEIFTLEAAAQKRIDYTNAGLTAAEAAYVLGDAMLSAAMDAALATKATDETVDAIKKIIKLREAVEGRSVGGGSGVKEKDPYEDILKSLMNVRNAAINAEGGLKQLLRLVGEGEDITIFKGLQEQLVLGNVADSFIQFLDGLDKEARAKFIKIGQDGVVSFTKVGKAMKKAFDEALIGEFVLGQRKVVRDLQNQKRAVDKLVAAGYSYKEAWEAVRDIQLATALATAKNKKEIDRIIAAFKAAKDAAEQFRSPLEKIEDVASRVSELFGRKRTVLEAQFNIDTAKSQEAIMAAENEIETLNFEMDDLNAGIQEIEWQEEAINAKYKDRFEALDKIQRVNEQISRQNKAQLSIAEALSSGDIGAAARAVQELRTQQAEQSVAKQRQNLEVAQQAELAALTSSNGRTREELEKRILEVQKQIFTIEESRLEPAQRAIELKQNELDLALFALDQQQSDWDIIYTKILDTLDPLKTYVQYLADARDILNNPGGPPVPDMESVVPVAAGTSGTSGGGGGGGGTQNQNIGPVVSGLLSQTKVKSTAVAASTTLAKLAGVNIRSTTADTAAKRISNFVTTATGTNRVGVPAGTSLRALMSGGGLVSYMANGGMTKPAWAKAMGTDTVPAMLTPGEFVVRRDAVSKIGIDSLKAINRGEYSGSSVYNYEVNVNVATNANANEIARTVMSQIKQIDSQRIRGVKL